jgi:hypothetical protein
MIPGGVMTDDMNDSPATIDETAEMRDDMTDTVTSGDWVAARIVGSDEEATLVVGFLNSNGIEAQVESLHSSEFPAEIGRLGEVHVMVPAERLEEAQQLLEQSEAEAAQAPPEGD